MARIRTIKPEFFTSEDIVALSPLARLLYISTWCEADKEGRLLWKPGTFKLRYFPADNCDIQALCGELVNSGLVVLYGDGLAYIPCFAKHQHVNPREAVSTLPAPSGVSDAMPRKVGKNTREEVLERDGNKCVRCGSVDRLQIDHILPQSCGGPHIAENLRVLCRSCNAGRPVSGAALVDDLAKDGYTLESLRAKFGIDASIPGLHAQGGREGKGRERKGKEGETPPSPLSCPAGVSETVWGDWLQLRKAKKAPVTLTVLSSATEEAEKAGMSMEAFLRVWCARGSQGLQADWLKPHERGSPAAVIEPEWRREQRERNEAFLGPAAAKRRTTVIDMEAPNAVTRIVG